MPEEKKQAFLETFSKLKQRVLWKWETDSLPGQPSNVKVGKWLPQSDILGKNIYIYIYIRRLMWFMLMLHMQNVPAESTKFLDKLSLVKLRQ